MQQNKNVFRPLCLPLACAVMLFFPCELFAQNAARQQGNEGATKANAEQDEPSRSDILRYALDSEVIALIDELIEEASTEYNSEIYELFLRSRNDNLRESIFKFFAEQKNPILEDECAKILDDPYEVKKALLAAAIRYAGEVGLTSILPQLHSLAESDNYDFASPAVKAIGKIGSRSDAAFLINLMQEDFFDNEKQRLIFRQDIMTALSSLDCSDIRDNLVEIVEDEDENAVIRAGAASALARLTNSGDVDTIAALFSESDPILRAGAVSALSGFASSQAARDVVLEAFKDSYYKVREEALAAAEKMNLTEATPYILYRAKTDPVESVKLKAFEVLGRMGSGEGIAFLTEVLNDAKASGKMRVKAADVLLIYHFDASFASVAQIAEAAVADKKQSWLCQELGKIIAKIETQSSAELAAAYLDSSDVVAQSLGLDMYEKNRYAQVRVKVEELAANKKAGAMQRRAERILGSQGAPQEQSAQRQSGGRDAAAPATAKSNSR